MSAYVAKDEIAMMIPNRLSHYFTDDPEYLVVAEPQSAGIFAKSAAVFKWLIDLPRRRMVMDELSSLSDHELADIGLSRSELTRVFEPSFAAQRNAGADAMATLRPMTV